MCSSPCITLAWTLLALSIGFTGIPFAEAQKDNSSLLLANYTFPENGTSYQDYLQICAFNIRIFGKKKAGKPKVMNIIAKVGVVSARPP